MPSSLNFDDEICLDAEEQGNEARFMNSVSPTTPPYIQKNASMSTVWCRGELRIIVSAVRNIPADQPVVLDYDEFENSYFERSSQPSTPSKQTRSLSPEDSPIQVEILEMDDESPNTKKLESNSHLVVSNSIKQPIISYNNNNKSLNTNSAVSPRTAVTAIVITNTTPSNYHTNNNKNNDSTNNSNNNSSNNSSKPTTTTPTNIINNNSPLSIKPKQTALKRSSGKSPNSTKRKRPTNNDSHDDNGKNKKKKNE